MFSNNRNSKAGLTALAAAFLFVGENAMSYEQPEYAVLYADGDVEYRQYEPYLVSETVIEGADNYDDAGDEGFRRLFQYITGANQSQSKIAMTVPVAQAPSLYQAAKMAANWEPTSLATTPTVPSAAESVVATSTVGERGHSVQLSGPGTSCAGASSRL